MNKHRKKVVIGLTVLFLMILTALVLGQLDATAHPTAAMVGVPQNGASPWHVFLQYLPGLVFIGMIILVIIYYERS